MQHPGNTGPQGPQGLGPDALSQELCEFSAINKEHQILHVTFSITITSRLVEPYRSNQLVAIWIIYVSLSQQLPTLDSETKMRQQQQQQCHYRNNF